MKKTIKEELINENDMLVYVQEDETIYVKIKFVDHKSVVEHYIARLTMEEYLAGDRIVFNEDKTAVAVFKKDNDQEILVNFYDLEEHNNAYLDFIDCAYNMKFKNKVNENFQLIKK